MSAEDASAALPTQQMVDSLEELFLVFTPRGEVLQWNDRVREVTGYTGEEIARMHPTDFAPADAEEGIAKQIQTILAEGRARFTTHIQAKDGREIPYEFTGSLLDRDGRKVICTFGRDVTRQQARQALEASEKQYRALTETAVDGIVVADADDNIIDWNDGARQIFGYTKAEMLGKSIERIMPERYRKRHREGMDRVNHTGEGRFLGRTIELEGLRKSGEEFPIELSLSSWTTDDERFFAGIIRDITERKETVQALRESEVLFRTLAEQSLVGIVLITGDGYTYANPRFGEIFGYETEELIGRPPEWIAHPEDKPTVRENVRRRLEGEVEALQYTFRGQTREGNVVYVEVFGTRMEYQGRPAIAGTVLDITDKRRMEREILRIQEEERRRIGQELHDGVASQLTGITMLTEALVKNLKKGQELTPGQLEEIVQLIREANQQTRRLSRGLNPVEVGREGLPAALEKLASICKERSGLLCTARTEGAVPELDEQTATHLYRIAQEGMNNAITHAQASRISIALVVQNGHLELSVRDDGQGLPDDVEVAEGIGLHTMRYRADLIGGRLEINTLPAGGTEVCCRLSTDAAADR